CASPRGTPRKRSPDASRRSTAWSWRSGRAPPDGLGRPPGGPRGEGAVLLDAARVLAPFRARRRALPPAFAEARRHDDPRARPLPPRGRAAFALGRLDRADGRSPDRRARARPRREPRLRLVPERRRQRAPLAEDGRALRVGDPPRPGLPVRRELARALRPIARAKIRPLGEGPRRRVPRR